MYVDDVQVLLNTLTARFKAFISFNPLANLTISWRSHVAPLPVWWCVPKNSLTSGLVHEWVHGYFALS